MDKGRGQATRRGEATGPLDDAAGSADAAPPSTRGDAGADAAPSAGGWGHRGSCAAASVARVTMAVGNAAAPSAEQAAHAKGRRREAPALSRLA